MSRGPGRIEQRIIALFAAATDRSFSVAELCDHAYELGGKTATRAQRLSATRAAHNLIGSLAEATRQCREALDRVIAEATVKLGRRPSGNHHTYFSNGVGWRGVDEKFAEIMQTSPGQQQYSAAHKALRRQMDRWGAAKHASWRATEMPDRRIRFHPADYPVRVWAVAIRPGGVVWAEAEIIRITERNVMVRYGGVVARLDRQKLARSWTLYRGVFFASRRTGYAARAFDDMWWQRYGQRPGSSAPPIMQMPLAEAIALLGVPADFTRDDIVLAFRREAKKAHPDLGGTAEMFRKLVEARDRLLASLGTSEPAPRMPAYAPVGAVLRYGTYRPSTTRGIGHTRKRLPGM